MKKKKKKHESLFTSFSTSVIKAPPNSSNVASCLKEKTKIN
jgi:hypothetical protein